MYWSHHLLPNRNSFSHLKVSFASASTQPIFKYLGVCVSCAPQTEFCWHSSCLQPHFDRLKGLTLFPDDLISWTLFSGAEYLFVLASFIHSLLLTVHFIEVYHIFLYPL